MSKLSNIIHYFATHDVAGDLLLKVWRRMDRTMDDDDRQAMRDVWDDHAHDTLDADALDEAYQAVAHEAGIQSAPAKVGSDDAVPTRWWRHVLRAAVWVIPVAMLGAAALFYQKGVRQRETLANTHFIQVFCDNAETRKVFLPDSTEVMLNGGSVLIYPSTFIGQERNVTLVGEAYFKVRHDDDTHFQVSVNHLRIRDLGTSFNVQSYPNLDETRVTLETGLLMVNNHRTDYRLLPNQQLVYSNRTGHVSIRAVRTSDYLAWQRGELRFEDEPLPMVFRMIEHHYDVHVRVMTQRYDHQQVRLRFDRNESLRGVLNVLSTVIPNLKWEIRGQEVIIR